MLKIIISPVQRWLLRRGQCVGCGTSLKQGRHRKFKKSGQQMVTCSCGRIFIHSKKDSTYRRALIEEVK